jgi:hypothetical protein
MAQATAEEGEKAQENEPKSGYFQKWKIAVIGLLAVPAVFTGSTVAGSLGFAAGTAFGSAIYVAIATLVHRVVAKRSPIRLFTPRGWAVYCVGTAILTVPLGVLLSAEAGSSASTIGVYSGVFLMLLIPGVVISKGLGFAQERFDVPSFG